MSVMTRILRIQKLTPDNSKGLEHEVHGDPVKDGADGERLGEVHQAEDDLESLVTVMRDQYSSGRHTQ
jgi:hypothetical protein